VEAPLPPCAAADELAEFELAPRLALDPPAAESECFEAPHADSASAIQKVPSIQRNLTIPA